ncbi:MAG: hypothetical protein KC418_22315 [Anaerolineales bacterium]|nr:hypothetical protein [Anaerolineales bacterium]MCB8954230.1 hypothetical protein [Ardenticatenales bacterium]
MRTIHFGSIWGVTISAKMPALISSLILWATLGAAGYLFLGLSLGSAVAGGFVAVLLHWLSDLGHQLGHVWAARRVGWPMQRLHLHWFLIGSFYPRDEPELPASVHIRRALGGSPASLLLSLLGLLAMFALRPTGGLPAYLSQFFFWENLLVFALGAFLPLGFTDGSTLLTWLPRLRQERQKNS